MTWNPFELREMLLFDQLGDQDLTIGERICIHQLIGQGIEPDYELKVKIKSILHRIKISGWVAPLVKINEARELEIITS